jgi:hypothetical protein
VDTPHPDEETTMNVTRLWALTALPFVLGACGDRDADEPVVTAEPVAGTDQASPAAAPADLGPDAIGMMSIGGDGLSGDMQVMGHGDARTMVVLNLYGPGTANTTHSGHIHAGSCENIGAVVVPLQDVTLTGGTGTASSTVDVPPATAMNGQHVVVYHERSGDNPGAPVVCGEIPAQA